MEEPRKIVAAMIKSPRRDANIRKGSGFSLGEINKAGKTVVLLKNYNIKIDYFRKSIHQSNIDVLKSLSLPEKKGKKRKPYTPKEKKIKAKPFKMKKKMAPPKTVKEDNKESLKKKEVPPKPKIVKKQKITTKKEMKALLLTDLSGLGVATAKKFQQVGVENISDLCKENPKELAMLVKGCSEDKIKKWIDEGKELLNS